MGYTIEAKSTKTNTIASEDHIVSASGSYSASLSWSPPQSTAGIILAAFKAGGSPPPDTTAPSVPAGLTANAVSSTQINLSWTASTDPDSAITGYQVSRNGVFVATSTSVSFSDIGLAASTNYTYTVTAFDPSGNISGKSSPVNATTQPPVVDTTAPTTPTTLTATAFSTSQIDLSWTASTDNVGVAGYQVFRNGAQVATSTLTAYQDSGLSAGTTNSYTVAAFDAAGNVSAQTLAAGATTLTPDVTAPSVPSNLVATAVFSSQINLSWSSSNDIAIAGAVTSGLAGYVIYRGGLAVATTTQSSYNDTGLAASTSYIYNVSANDNANNNSAQSSQAGATTLAAGAGTPVPVGTWTHIVAGGFTDSEVVGYDKSTYVSSKQANCILGNYKQHTTSEIDEAIICYSYPENRWSVLDNFGYWNASHNGEGGHSQSGFVYAPDLDSIFYISDGAGSSAVDGLFAHFWQFDVAGLSGRDKQVTPMPWMGAIGAVPIFVYDSFNKKLISWSDNGPLFIYDPATNTTFIPSATGPVPNPSDINGTMTYDPDNQLSYYYGGMQAGIYTVQCNTAACTSVTWNKLSTTCSGTACSAGAPPTRTRAGMAYSTADHIFLMAGGTNGGVGVPNPAGFTDTWAFNPATNAWTQLVTPSTYPNNGTNSPFDKLTYDTSSNVFILVANPGGFLPAIYAFPFSPAMNYGRTSSTYAASAGSLNRNAPQSGQSWVFDPAIASAGTNLSTAWIETGINGDNTTCGAGHHPMVQTLSGSTWAPDGTCLSLNPENSGFVDSSKEQIAYVNGTLWEAHEESNGNAGFRSTAYAHFWNGSAWVGGAVPCNFSTCGTNSAVDFQFPAALIAAGNTPTIALIEENTNSYSREQYLYVSQYNGASWNKLGSGPLNANGPGSGTRATNAALATDGTNFAACWSEEINDPGSRSAFTLHSQIRCSQWNGAAWVAFGSSPISLSTADWAYDPSITYMKGAFYVAWTERTTSGTNQLYVCQWNGSACNLLGGGSLNITAATGWAVHPSLTTDGTNAYVSWEEQPSLNQPSLAYVKKWNGFSWSQLGGSLNMDTITGSAEGTVITVAQGVPTVLWGEVSWGNLRQAYAKQWDGANWIDISSGILIPPDITAPSVPTNLTAISISPFAINLFWNASTDSVGVAGYQIFRNGNQIATSAAASFQDATLSISTTYTYNVTAFDAAGNISAQSSPTQATTLTPVPAIPSFTASSAAIIIGGSSILSWSTSGAASVSIDQGIGSVTASGSATVSPVTTTVYTLTATNSGGVSTAQVTVTVGLAPDTSPPQITVTVLDSNSQPIVGGNTVFGNLNFTVTASDPTITNQQTSGLNSISVSLDGTVVATATTGSLNLSLSTRSLLNKNHAVVVTARDNAGNVAVSQSFLLNEIGFMAVWQ